MAKSIVKTWYIKILGGYYISVNGLTSQLAGSLHVKVKVKKLADFPESALPRVPHSNFVPRQRYYQIDWLSDDPILEKLQKTVDIDKTIEKIFGQNCYCYDSNPLDINIQVDIDN